MNDAHFLFLRSRLPPHISFLTKLEPEDMLYCIGGEGTGTEVPGPVKPLTGIEGGAEEGIQGAAEGSGDARGNMFFSLFNL